MRIGDEVAVSSYGVPWLVGTVEYVSRNGISLVGRNVRTDAPVRTSLAFLVNRTFTVTKEA